MLTQVEAHVCAVRVVIIHERRVRTGFASRAEAAAAQGAVLACRQAFAGTHVGREAVPLTSLCHAEANGWSRGRSGRRHAALKRDGLI